MPRKRTSKPVQEVAEAEQAARSQAAETRPAPETHVSDRQSPAAHEEAGDASFDVAALERPKPRLAGLARDDRNGIRVAVETERKPGQAGPRVLIQFRNDAPPSREEKAILQAEGFAYRPEEKSWAAPRTAANVVVAKRAVNEITRLRGDEGVQLYI